jgi:hypothetical protein
VFRIHQILMEPSLKCILYYKAFQPKQMSFPNLQIKAM